MKTTLVKQISQTIKARENCIKSNNPWADKHEEILNQLNDLLPSGSGIDNGTKLDIEASKPDRLAFNFSYHHMNELERDIDSYDGMNTQKWESVTQAREALAEWSKQK